MKQKIVSIVGLTASGKSAIGIELARQFNGEIISSDSRQVYRGLDVGTAKVTKQEQSMAVHHLIDVMDAGEHFDVFEFQQAAYMIIDDILSRGKLPIIVGGTGLYSRAIVEGYNFKAENKPKYDVLQIALMPPKEYISERIITRIKSDNRTTQIFNEVSNLIKSGVKRDWLKKLGLEYYWGVLLHDREISSSEFEENLATKTIQFAKRQRTWFKKEKNTHFLTEPSTFLQDCKKLVELFL